VSRPPPANRLEVDREDLMREATALRQRAEFDVRGESESVIAGYRPNGSLSIYFGPDPCYHFDPDLRLRRAYVDGDLYRTQGTTLARLHRDRTSGTVDLQRHDLTPNERTQFMERVIERLSRFAASVEDLTVRCVQQIPKDGDTPRRISGDLKSLITQPLTLAPPIRGKK